MFGRLILKPTCFHSVLSTAFGQHQGLVNGTNFLPIHLVVTPLVLQVYFRDHTGSLDNPNMNTESERMNYDSDFLIGSTFRICSPIGNISVTLPWYQLNDDSDRAEHRYNMHYL